jgi:hypothetical protein
MRAAVTVPEVCCDLHAEVESSIKRKLAELEMLQVWNRLGACVTALGLRLLADLPRQPRGGAASVTFVSALHLGSIAEAISWATCSLIGSSSDAV